MQTGKQQVTGYRRKSSRDPQEYSLGMRNAEDHYSNMCIRRDLILTRARELAELTIPSLVPPEGYQEGDKLYVPYQDIGARCINTLSSKLTLTLLPPNRAPFRHSFPDHLIEEMKKAASSTSTPDEKLKALKSALDLGLSKREQAAKSYMESTALRMVLNEGFKQLIVAGNYLYRHQDLDLPQLHRMDTYVVKRNKKGFPLLTILKEQIAYVDLDEDLKEAVDAYQKTAPAKDEWDRTVDIYYVCKKSGGKWYSWQEMCGGWVVEGSEAQDPIESPPLWPVWMIPMYGQDWGRSYADEYYSGFLSAENYSKALQEGAIAAAWTLFFTKPGGRTRPKQLKEARNLDILVGSAEDITTLRLEKSADFNIASQNLEQVERRLGFAFLLNSAVQRDGERVTAEEIRLMARELDEAMGGVYAALAQNLQKIFVHRFLHLMEKAKELPALPGTAKIKIRIVSGIDALGRSYDDQLLDELFAEAGQLFGPTEVAKRINLGEYFRRKAAAKSIDPEGLIRTDEEVAEEDQNNQMLALAQQAAPGIATQGTRGVVEDMLNQRQADMGAPPQQPQQQG